MPNISVRQGYPSSGATLNGKDFEQGLSAMYTKDSPMFNLAIDFFDEFGLQRLTEPEKPLNEMSSDCKMSNDCKERALIKERL